MKSMQRNGSLDLVRAMAAFCVVVNHVIEHVYSFNYDSITALTTSDQKFCFALYILGRMGVPLFLLLTGYLLLAKEYDQAKIKHFYTHNFLQLLVVWEIWIIIYQVFICWFYEEPFDFSVYLLRALFLKNARLGHTWYIPMIIGMYLFLPFVSVALNKINGKLLAIFLVVSFIYIFVVPGINLFQNVYNTPTDMLVNSQLDMSFGGNVYGFYLILGYCFARYKDKIDKAFKQAIPVVAIGVLGFRMYLTTVRTQFMFYSIGYPNNVWYVWYDFMLMPICGGCIFLILNKIKLPKLIQRIVTELSVCSFGIYLVHYIMVKLSIRYLGDIAHKKLEVVALSFAIYFLAFVIIEIMSLIPHLGYIFMKKK